jgi:hypothetical protein
MLTRSRRAFLAAAGAAAAVALLYWCLWRLSWTVAATSDGAANVLQAGDMLHGNWLLHGWTVSDVSFYTTELPEYALAELIGGLGVGTIHIAAAATYTMLVVLAALVAAGRSRGGDALAGGITAVVIMLAPQLGYGAFVLLLSPDHTGTQVPLLAGWLLLDRAPRRWYVPAALGALLAWVQVGDRIALVTAVVPLIAVCCWRALRYRRVAAWEAALAGAAAVSVAAAEAASRLLAAAGGPRVSPLRFVPSSLLWTHLRLTGEGILELFGASFSGIQGWPQVFFAVTHLAGLALAAAGFALAAWRLIRCRPGADLVSGVLAVAVAGNLLSYAISTDPGTALGTGYAAREIAAVLPLGAVLAGRELRRRVPAGREVTAGGDRARGQGRSGWRWAVLGVLLGCYAAALGYGAAQPAAPGQYSVLASWLVRHRLSYGLGGVESNIATVDSGARVRLAGVITRGGRVVPLLYQSRLPWYDAGDHDATFLVLSAPGAEPGDSPQRFSYQAVTATFGKPARIYRFSGFTVATWKHNILARLHPGV